MGNFWVNRIIDVYMRWVDWTLRASLLKAAMRVEHTQAALLASILNENADTEFGRSHDFASISDVTTYRARVPLQTYDQLEPYVDQQKNGAPALTKASPVYYARTSGTTGRSKDIPLTEYGLRQVKHAQKNLALSLWRDTKFFQGSILGFVSPVEEGRLKSGQAYGSTSGSTYKSLSPVLARKFVVPRAAFSLEDLEAKYQTYAMSALATGNITGVVAANPSSILKVARLIESHAQRYISILSSDDARGTVPQVGQAFREIADRAEPVRLKKLQDILDKNGVLKPDDIWPKLSAVATWTGGSCGVALDRLRSSLPTNVIFVEYGYASSEFVGSANVDVKTNLCLPLLTEHVYEFVLRDKWEAGEPEFLGLHQISPGEDYYVFVTTRSGLYRYNINDIVRAELGIGQCPGLRFLQKGRGVTNITGEKLSEDQLIAAIDEVSVAEGLGVETFMALADEDASQYAIYLECSGSIDRKHLAEDIDGCLRRRNSEYDDKRASGRLRSLKLQQLEAGASEVIKKWSLDRGVREAQYKPTLIDYSRNWADKLAPLVLEHRS